MILYFDTLITDKSLSPRNPYAAKEDIRSKSPAYKMPRKIDITKYTLASYAVYPWSHVLIKYELENASSQDIESFDKFILNLFPKAQIIHERSDSQKDYQESVKILDAINDDWVFYSPNNDQPMLISQESDVAYIDRLIKKAESFTVQNPFVSIAYSTWTSYLRALDSFYGYFGKGAKLLKEDDDCLCVYCPLGDYSSIQIVNKNLFRDWFTFKDLGDRFIIRAEDLYEVRSKDQIELIPKKELCAHFDQYEHMLGYQHEIWNEVIPPLIIPQGFFEDNIKIAYGYDSYRPGWTNINPMAKKYSFEDIKYGTDLKIGLEDVPLFWKPKIKQLDINPKLDKAQEQVAIKRNLEIIRDPWKFQKRQLNFKSFRFRLKRLAFPYRKFLDRFGLIPILKKIFRY